MLVNRTECLGPYHGGRARTLLFAYGTTSISAEGQAIGGGGMGERADGFLLPGLFTQ